MKTFITELNHEQVDVMGKHYPDHVRPFIDRIEVFSGEDARASNKMLIVKDDFLDIFNNEESQYEITHTFLRDKPASEDLITIFPKFVGIDISKKEVEVLFNA